MTLYTETVEATINLNVIQNERHNYMISTIVGGLLVVIGGFISNVLLQSRTRRKETRDTRRAKLEQICKLSHEVCELTGEEVARWATVRLDALRSATGSVSHDSCIVKSPVGLLYELQMLVKFYHPNPSQHADQLDKAFRFFFDGCAQYAESFLSGKASPALFKRASERPSQFCASCL